MAEEGAGPAEESAFIASEKDLEEFQRCPEAEKMLSPALRGVLAETALTGVVRYKWTLLRPLFTFALERAVRGFDAAEAVEVGPAAPPSAGDADVDALLARFRSALWAFDAAPWTAQRLAELLLEPRKQYAKLAKLAVAVEKLLLVTGELAARPPPGPPPRLSELRPVNEVPPRPPAAAEGARVAGAKRPRAEEPAGINLAAAALDVWPLLPDAAAAGSSGGDAHGGGGGASGSGAAADADVPMDGGDGDGRGAAAAHTADGDEGGAAEAAAAAPDGGEASAAAAAARPDQGDEGAKLGGEPGAAAAAAPGPGSESDAADAGGGARTEGAQGGGGRGGRGGGGTAAAATTGSASAPAAASAPQAAATPASASAGAGDGAAAAAAPRVPAAAVAGAS